MVPRWMAIGFVVPTYWPLMVVWDSEYIFPINLIASVGYPRSSMIARSLAWSMDPKALMKSIYSRYISCDVNLASSKATIIVCICLLVQHSWQKPSRLLCIIWCCLPYDKRSVVKVLVKSLYIVSANAIGRWLLS
jgi:hypothetical protein